MPIITSDDDIRRILETTGRLAVVGAHPAPAKPAHYVPAYLTQQGYQVVPVNPKYAGETLFGAPVVATLADVPGAVDMVVFFRRSAALPDYVEPLLAMSPRPAVVWFQSGIRHDEVAQTLSDAGIDVVQDRCTYATHRAMGLSPRGGSGQG